MPIFNCFVCKAKDLSASCDVCPHCKFHPSGLEFKDALAGLCNAPASEMHFIVRLVKYLDNNKKPIVASVVNHALGVAYPHMPLDERYNIAYMVAQDAKGLCIISF
jgi:hypothetical protein